MIVEERDIIRMIIIIELLHKMTEMTTPETLRSVMMRGVIMITQAEILMLGTAIVLRGVRIIIIMTMIRDCAIATMGVALTIAQEIVMRPRVDTTRIVMRPSAIVGNAIITMAVINAIIIVMGGKTRGKVIIVMMRVRAVRLAVEKRTRRGRTAEKERVRDGEVIRGGELVRKEELVRADAKPSGRHQESLKTLIEEKRI
jgi:hypothetical protein